MPKKTKIMVRAKTAKHLQITDKKNSESIKKFLILRFGNLCPEQK